MTFHKQSTFNKLFNKVSEGHPPHIFIYTNLPEDVIDYPILGAEIPIARKLFWQRLLICLYILYIHI